MNIAVCFKVEPKLETMQKDDWIVNNNKVDTSFLIDEISLIDESALEIGLRIKDENPSTILKAITVNKTSTLIKNLYSLNYDEIIQINNEEEINFYPEIAANLIAAYLKKLDEKQDIIIMGQKSLVGYNSKTPYVLSELINYPCISEVTEIKVDKENNTLIVQSNSDFGNMIQTVTPPCILSLGNVQNSYLRLPTLREKLKAKKKEVTKIEVNKLIDNSLLKAIKENYELIELSKVNTDREGIIIDGDNMASKVTTLFRDYLKDNL
ncbi:MAG: electron transfer flavoprotein subunit beta/FixA family protein [Pleomorphochaeta sp.]